MEDGPPPPRLRGKLPATVFGTFVVAQPQERRVADAAVGGPLREPDFADELRLHPLVAPARGRAGLQRRGGARERPQPPRDELVGRPLQPPASLLDNNQAVRPSNAAVEPSQSRA